MGPKCPHCGAELGGLGFAAIQEDEDDEDEDDEDEIEIDADTE